MTPPGPTLGIGGLMQELLGCEWGRRISAPDDQEVCHERADQIVVLHEGDAEAGFKLCSRHRDRVMQETTTRETSG